MRPLWKRRCVSKPRIEQRASGAGRIGPQVPLAWTVERRRASAPPVCATTQLLTDRPRCGPRMRVSLPGEASVSSMCIRHIPTCSWQPRRRGCGCHRVPSRECRLGVWFGFVGAALLPAVGTCVVVGVRGDACSVMLSPCNTGSPATDELHTIPNVLVFAALQGEF